MSTKGRIAFFLVIIILLIGVVHVSNKGMITQARFKKKSNEPLWMKTINSLPGEPGCNDLAEEEEVKAIEEAYDAICDLFPQIPERMYGSHKTKPEENE